MSPGPFFLVLGLVLLTAHLWVLPAIERSVLRRRPASRFAREEYVEYRKHHKSASLVAAVIALVLGVCSLLFR